MTTLAKKARFAPPAPYTPVPPLRREYAEEAKYPVYGVTQVFSLAEANVVMNPSKPMRYIVSGAGKDALWAHNWFKRVLIGYQTVTVYKVELTPQPQPPRPQPTPYPDSWDATARSVEAFADPVRATFMVGVGTLGGVVAGLTTSAARMYEGHHHVMHGFKIEQGVAYVYTGAPDGMPQAPGAAEVLITSKKVVPGDLMEVKSISGAVEHLINGELMARVPSFLAHHPAHLAAALYSVTDTIVGATIEPLAAAAMGRARLRLSVKGGDAYSDGAAKLRIDARGWASTDGARLRVFAGGGSGEPGSGVLKLPALRSYGVGLAGKNATGTARLFSRFAALGGDSAYSAGAVALGLYAFARTDEPDYSLAAFSAGRMQVLESVATFPHRGLHCEAFAGVAFDASIGPTERMNVTGKLGAELRGSLRILGSFLVRAAGDAAMTAHRLLEAAFVSPGALGAPLAGMLLVTEGLHTVGAVAAELSAGRSVDGSLIASAGLASAMDAQQVLSAALQALGHIGVQMGEPGKNVSVWAVNTATGASSAYEDYPFNSFAQLGGKHYGATADGIYELTGDDDAGAPIQASIHLGQRDFGSSRLKALPNAYIGVSSTGQMVVRVTTEGRTYTYRARSAGAEMQTQRVDFGRGLRANYITLELLNEAGADFDLDKIEFTVAELGRRI